MPAALIPVLDDAREGDAAYLASRQGILVLAANILHGVSLEGHALVRQDDREVDAQDSLLDGKQAGQFNGVTDKDTQGRVARLAGRGGRGGGGGVEDTVDAGDDTLRKGRRLFREALGSLAADEGEGGGAPVVDGFVLAGWGERLVAGIGVDWEGKGR